MPIHLVVIDALNLIRRIHAAQPDPNDILKTQLTCSRAIEKIINHTQPTHMVAVFEQRRENRGWRAEILPEYKQNRKPMPSVLEKGLDNIQDVWMAMGIDSLLSDGDEADDLVATLATKLASRQEQVTIISTDKGYCQLLEPTLRIRDYFQERWLDYGFVQTQFGLTPQQLTDFWGLAGINGSGLTGVPGIGAKSAKALLQEYGNLETIFYSNELPAKWQKKLQGNRELAQKTKQIATLLTNVNLGFNLQDIRIKLPA